MTQSSGQNQSRRGADVRAAVERAHNQRGDQLTGRDGQDIEDAPDYPHSTMEPAEGPDDPDYDGEASR